MTTTTSCSTSSATTTLSTSSSSSSSLFPSPSPIMMYHQSREIESTIKSALAFVLLCRNSRHQNQKNEDEMNDKKKMNINMNHPCSSSSSSSFLSQMIDMSLQQQQPPLDDATPWTHVQNMTRVAVSTILSSSSSSFLELLFLDFQIPSDSVFLLLDGYTKQIAFLLQQILQSPSTSPSTSSIRNYTAASAAASTATATVTTTAAMNMNLNTRKSPSTHYAPKCSHNNNNNKLVGDNHCEEEREQDEDDDAWTWLDILIHDILQISILHEQQ